MVMPIGCITVAVCHNQNAIRRRNEEERKEKENKEKRNGKN